VKQVLAFASGAEGKRATLQIRHVIIEIQRIIRETFPKEIELQLDIAPNLWTIYGDATQMFQILMNLCVNARDAMPAGGQIQIKAGNFEIDENYARMNLEASVGGYVAITVTDTGVGIAPDIRERIFEPFFTTKDANQGTGLGLPTAMSLVKKHDGFLDIYSEPGQGTQVNVFIPADQASETANPDSLQLPQGQGELILVVDDEDSIRSITQKTLENYNYRVMTAADGIDAIACYGQHQDQVRAVLLDMMMPTMDGVMAIRTLRKMNPDLKIIAISGLRKSDKITAALAEGISRFLPKPFTAEALLTALQVALDN
ncbi:hybrid sensor histidine kinase/response regulator, partial [filamentous cyanobacterium CCP5]